MPIMSQRAYSRHRGVSLSAVQKAIKTKRISTLPDGRIDSEVADREWERNTTARPRAVTNTAPKRPAAESDDSEFPGSRLNGAYSQARAVREQYEARLTRIKYERESGKLVNRDEVQVAAFNRFRTFRDAMLNIPDRVVAPINVNGLSLKL